MDRWTNKGTDIEYNKACPFAQNYAIRGNDDQVDSLALYLYLKS